MRQLLVLAGAALLASSASSLAQAANPPTYRTIAPAQARTKKTETRYRAEVQPLPAQPYAYGWFGAKPRQQSSWQRDYYEGLRFWSRGGW
jgi:hypothetical protein